MRALVEVCTCGAVKEVQDGKVVWRPLAEWERVSLANEPGIGLSHTMCQACSTHYRKLLQQIDEMSGQPADMKTHEQ